MLAWVKMDIGNSGIEIQTEPLSHTVENVGRVQGMVFCWECSRKPRCQAFPLPENEFLSPLSLRGGAETCREGKEASHLFTAVTQVTRLVLCICPSVTWEGGPLRSPLFISTAPARLSMGTTSHGSTLIDWHLWMWVLGNAVGYFCFSLVSLFRNLIL